MIHQIGDVLSDATSWKEAPLIVVESLLRCLNSNFECVHTQSFSGFREEIRTRNVTRCWKVESLADTSKGHGLVALRNIAAGELVIEVSNDLMFSKLVQPECLKEVLSLASDNSVFELAVCLVYHKLNIGSSPYRNYINSLPEKFRCIGSVRAIASLYCRFIHMLDNLTVPCIGMTSDQVSWPLFRWAMCAVITRQNSIPLSVSESGSGAGCQSVLALVPGWDLINHEEGAMTTGFDMGSECLQHHAMRHFVAGEEITMCYGHRNNEQLLIYSGFVVPDNCDDVVNLAVIIPRDGLSKIRDLILKNFCGILVTDNGRALVPLTAKGALPAAAVMAAICCCIEKAEAVQVMKLISSHVIHKHSTAQDVLALCELPSQTQIHSVECLTITIEALIVSNQRVPVMSACIDDGTESFVNRSIYGLVEGHLKILKRCLGAVQLLQSTATNAVPVVGMTTVPVQLESDKVSILVAWNNIEWASSYVLQMSANDEGWTTLSDDVQTNTIRKKNLVSGVNYRFRVQGRNIKIKRTGEFGDSSEPMHVLDHSSLQLSPPTRYASDSNSITIQWSPISNARGYNIKYRDETMTNWICIDTVIERTSMKKKNLSPGKQYYFAVKPEIPSNSLSYEYSCSSLGFEVASLSPFMHNMVPQKLLGPGNDTTSSVALAGKVVGVYFSAHWCGPCRQFTPALSQLYQRAQAENKPFEIVFCSCDHDEAEFKSYFASMPWLAVEYYDSAREALSGRFQVSGIPRLTILAPTGHILADNISANMLTAANLDGWISRS